MRVSDVSEILKIDKKLELYTYPDANLLKRNQTFGLFLGQFFEWDGHKNAETAKKVWF